MNRQRIEHIRNHAITCLELTKGFTPEQRGNSINGIDELAGYILELTSMMARQNPEFIPSVRSVLEKLANNDDYVDLSMGVNAVESHIAKHYFPR